MPHVIIEYTANVEADARIPELMRALNDVLICNAAVFPIGGIRTRALRLDQTAMPHRRRDDAFSPVTFHMK